MCKKAGFRFLALAVVALIALSASKALALGEKRSLNDLAAEASHIVMGEVVSVVSRWNESKSEIFTDVRIAATQYLKGEGEKEPLITVPGGQVDDIGQWVEGAPTFVEGEEVILFLGKGGEVVGGSQGKFTLIDGLVAEADMVSMFDFMADLNQVLDQQGARPAPVKGSTQGIVVEKCSAVLDPSLPKVTIDNDPIKAKAVPETWLGIKYEDFEGAFPGTSWAIHGTPSWDDTPYKAYAGAWSGWCADTTMSAPGPYAANMNAWMVYGPFSLVGISDARVEFRHWLDSEPNYDWLQILTSINGTNFSGHQISGRTRAWSYWNYNISSRLGQAQVWVAFRFVSDASIQYEGAYLDNILISKDDRRPNITGVSPSSASAGTNTVVTLSGTGFGATQGSSTVQFWRVGGTWLTASIVSWGDTQIRCKVPGGASSHTSQALKVTTSYGTAYKAFAVTFSYMGVRWPAPHPFVKYYTNENTADCTGEGAAVRKGAWAWVNADAHALHLSWWGNTTRGFGYDGYNVILWANLGSTGPIAVCTTWYSGSSILEFDIKMNDYYTWSTAATCPVDKMDVQNIATHELGHGGVGLNDLYGSPDSEKTMYGYSGNGETKKRTLGSVDILGIRWIYPN